MDGSISSMLPKVQRKRAGESQQGFGEDDPFYAAMNMRGQSKMCSCILHQHACGPLLFLLFPFYFFPFSSFTCSHFLLSSLLHFQLPKLPPHQSIIFTRPHKAPRPVLLRPSLTGMDTSSPIAAMLDMRNNIPGGIQTTDILRRMLRKLSSSNWVCAIHRFVLLYLFINCKYTCIVHIFKHTGVYTRVSSCINVCMRDPMHDYGNQCNVTCM